MAQLVARLLWEQDAAGSSPVTSTTGSAGPKNRGLTLLIFYFITRWRSFVMDARTQESVRWALSFSFY